MQNKSPIMQTIKTIEDAYFVNASNASIKDNYIIPGIMGRMVNATKSFVNMKAFGIFNEYYLIFDDVKPEISLEDNKDKIIKEGNKEKKSVAIILEDGNNILKKYLKENKKTANILVTEQTYESNNYFEQINSDTNKYSNVESLLNKNNQNKNICYIKLVDKDFCIKEKKYLVEETFSLGANNIIEAKKKLDSGSIILIKKTATLDNLKLLIKEIEFKGLNIISLSELISEKNQK